MKISRDTALLINVFFEALTPPILRDNKWFMMIPLKLLFGDKAKLFYDYKVNAPNMSKEEIVEIYRETLEVHIDRETDLNISSLQEIESKIIGTTVLDIACGRGFLSKRLSDRYQVTAADIIIDEKLKTTYSNIRFVESDLEKLPFADKEFDTVISAHTIEHTQNLYQALSELRRVCAKRLIIIIPKQRPYQITFDLHLHFFPYQWNVMIAFLGRKNNGVCYSTGMDWFYMETRDDMCKDK